MPMKRHVCRECGIDIPQEGRCERCASLADLPSSDLPQPRSEPPSIGRPPKHLKGVMFIVDDEPRATEAEVLRIALRTLDVEPDGWVCVSVDRTPETDEGRWTFARLDSQYPPDVLAWLTCVDSFSGWRYDLRV